jgi:hypothetical protein
LVYVYTQGRETQTRAVRKPIGKIVLKMAVLLDQKQDRKITKLCRRQKEEGIQIR